MANTDFMDVVVRDVKLIHPKLNGWYRFNKQTNKSEPCAQTANNAAQSVGWEWNADDARQLWIDVKAHYEKCRAAKPSMPAFGGIFGMKKKEDGTVTFVAKRNGTNSRGQLADQPKVVDRMKRDLENRGIWSGSRGTIVCSAFPTVDPEGKGGISLGLSVVQVVDPVYGSTGLDYLDEIPDEHASPAMAALSKPQADQFDPFSAGATAPAAAAPAKTVQEVLGDDIPF